ncbi:MAG: carbohydrate-binding family 9-like protein [Kiritimatiellia bacterium]
MPSYTIRSASAAPKPDSDWSDPVWQKAATAKIAWFHGKSEFRHPVTTVKVLHTPKGIHLFFRVEDRHVIARCTRYQEQVCQDSCVEFFVEPPGNRGYLNFEFNCIGTLLLYHITDPTRKGKSFTLSRKVPRKLAKTMTIHSTFTGKMKKAVPGPVVWFLQAFIPFSLFESLLGPITPVAGSTWRGNFYKCGSDHPHYVCWAPVGKLNFHQPQFFGKLLFAKK